MLEIEGNGSGMETRTGAGVLALLADLTNVMILREIATAGPTSPSDIAGEPGDERLYDLTPGGREQIFTARTLEAWLGRAPGGAIGFGDPEWEWATEALIGGWSTTIVHRLASGSRSLAELDEEIAGLSYPILERHVIAMRDLGQLEANREDGEASYAVTDWLREAVAPLAVASRSERLRTPEESPPIAPLDVEAGFGLALPLLRLPERFSGSCRLGVELPGEGEPTWAGVTAQVESGRIASCSTDLETAAKAAASGGVEAWFGAVIDRKLGGLELEGSEALARAILTGLHEALFGARG